MNNKFVHKAYIVIIIMSCFLCFLQGKRVGLVAANAQYTEIAKEQIMAKFPVNTLYLNASYNKN